MSGWGLTRYFIVTSLVTFAIMAAVLGYLVPKLLMDDLRGEYEHGNINYANLLANQFWVDDFAPLLDAMTGKSAAEIQAALQISDLHRRVLTVLRGTSVFKVKVYDLKGVTIYSTDLQQIGEDKSQNGGVIAGLKGKTNSELVHRDHFSDLEGEILGRDLVQTYVPQFDSPGGKVTGVFEICSDSTQFLAEARHAQRRILGAVFALLSLLYLALFIIVHRAQRIIQRHNSERARVEEALKFVAQGGWAAGGTQFFSALAEFLGRMLGMDYVLIDELANDGESAETVGLYARGEVVPNMHYVLHGTPCENVLGKNLCVFPRGVQKLFPLDTLLVNMQVESYIGIPLWDSRHKPIGLIACMDGRPLADAASVQAVLQVVATRAAAELERKQADDVLRESEGRLSAIFQASPIGISITNLADGKILDVNNSALKLYGYTRDEMIGRTVSELGIYVVPEQREELVRQLHEHGSIDRFQISFRKSSGDIGQMESSCRVVDLQNAQCLVAMMVDVTERKRLEQAQRLESLGTLAGGIAHDFNNILTAIRGNVALATQDVGRDHAAAVSLKEIEKAGGRASELVRRIMAFGRPREVAQKVVDLSAIVGEVQQLLRSTLPASIALRTKFARGTPPVLADAGQVHEAIVNLTTNAAYAIGQQTGSIEFMLEPVEVGGEPERNVPGLKRGRYARLTVTDSGCGIDAAALEHIFDAFYTTKPVGEGTGLGLSMVHGIMRSHRGTVTVESSPGKGSIFALYFPAAEQKKIQEDNIAPSHGQLKVRRRVLYVEDEEALASLASRGLSRLGHQVRSFTDPEAALAAFRARPHDFDIVVTDLSMPHMSGFDLAQAMLALRPGMQIVMVTGYSRSEDVDRAHALGIRELILKPVAMDELGSVFDRLFRADQERFSTLL